MIVASRPYDGQLSTHVAVGPPELDHLHADERPARCLPEGMYSALGADPTAKGDHDP